jgi:hypothetical protein
MRKTVVSLLLLGSLFLSASTLFAYSFDINGVVNTSAAMYEPSIYGTTTVSKITYSFTVISSPPGVGMWFLGVEFDKDLFQSVSITDFIPSNWVNFTLNSTEDTYLLSFGAPSIGLEETLSFSLSAVLTDGAFDNPSLWSQSWMAMSTSGSSDFGTTAPVPEPASMLLFGSGLIAFAFGKRKFTKNSFIH